MQSKPVVVWVCISNTLRRRAAGKHHSIKRNMWDIKKKISKMISSLMSLNSVHLVVNTVTS